MPHEPTIPISGVRWSVHDRYGHPVYLTEERWRHIGEPTNHPEMADCEDELKETLRAGVRKQDSLNPQKFRYSNTFDGLPDGATHLVAIVLFRFRETGAGLIAPNNYVVTAYLKTTR
ncbi:MAG: hypothetical protein GY856_00440 [bacterium]|nr:hypothetical protein [bacterium]